MISGGELEVVWSVIGKLAVIVGAVVAITQGFKYLMSLMPVSKLELRVKECEDQDKNILERLNKVDVRVDTLSKQVDGVDREMGVLTEGMQRIGKSQISLLRHFVTGNGQQEMENEANDLTEFFIDRR